jgi:transcriptional regulator of nitric oxide reductase
LKREAGTSIRGGVVPALTPDFVAGATVTARAMRGAVADAARLVLRARMPLPQVSEPTLNREQYRRVAWDDLLAEGAVARRRITAGEVAAALGMAPEGATDRVFTDLYAALLTPAALGGSLIGLNRYNEYMRRFPSGAQVIAVASSGPYDFLGDDYVRAAKGFRFDRIHVTQNGRTYHFVNSDFLRLDTRAHEGFLAQQYAALFALPPNFDPLKDWRLELLVRAGEKERRVPAAPTGCLQVTC